MPCASSRSPMTTRPDAERLERLEFAVRVSAHHDVDAGIQLARDFDDAARQEAVGRGDDEQAGMFDAGGVEHPGRGGVTFDGGNALRSAPRSASGDRVR